MANLQLMVQLVQLVLLETSVKPVSHLLHAQQAIHHLAHFLLVLSAQLAKLQLVVQL